MLFVSTRQNSFPTACEALVWSDETFDGGEDFVGGFGPPEGFEIFVVPVDEARISVSSARVEVMNAAPQVLPPSMSAP